MEDAVVLELRRLDIPGQSIELLPPTPSLRVEGTFFSQLSAGATEWSSTQDLLRWLPHARAEGSGQRRASKDRRAY